MPPFKSCDKSSAVAEIGDRLATIGMGRKVGAAMPPFFLGGAGFPSNTMWTGPRPTSVPSGILIQAPTDVFVCSVLIYVQRIRGFTTMRYINLRFTYLLTYHAAVWPQ